MQKDCRKCIFTVNGHKVEAQNEKENKKNVFVVVRQN